MPYRPNAQFRRNIKGVIYPLTEAVRRTYGCRSVDGAYPIGAFYPINVSNKSWSSAGAIWYRPRSMEHLNSRSPNEDVVISFMESILSGEPVELPSGVIVTWEDIPNEEAEYLLEI